MKSEAWVFRFQNLGYQFDGLVNFYPSTFQEIETLVFFPVDKFGQIRVPFYNILV